MLGYVFSCNVLGEGGVVVFNNICDTHFMVYLLSLMLSDHVNFGLSAVVEMDENIIVKNASKHVWSALCVYACVCVWMCVCVYVCVCVCMDVYVIQKHMGFFSCFFSKKVKKTTK